ncbi:MAG: ABC transporter ATP-binding protein [Burkholderiales bacterium]|nr:ABC transporter ATP-binding protein [Burkholderiales bacterium]
MSGVPALAAVEIDELEIGVGTGTGGRTLVRGLSLRMRPGEVWCVLGANGTGKSTLLHTLIGLHRATAGTIRLAGRPLDAWPVEAAARVRGFLPQFIHDTFDASVLDIVLMGRHPHVSRWHWEGDADRDAARAALAALGLAPLAERDITTLSGGERQRVAIAALLAQDPGILLLDEPINHLDLHHQIVVLQHLSELARDRGKAVLFSIHDLNLARRFATHALILQDGGLVRHGPAAAVMNAPVLSAAFGYPVLEARVGARTVFIAE